MEGLFKSKHNSTDKVAQLQAMTFYALLQLADMKAAATSGTTLPDAARRDGEVEDVPPAADPIVTLPPRLNTELHYTIQIHLPATKDIEVFNAIFRSLRENLLS